MSPVALSTSAKSQQSTTRRAKKTSASKPKPKSSPAVDSPTKPKRVVKTRFVAVQPQRVRTALRSKMFKMSSWLDAIDAALDTAKAEAKENETEVEDIAISSIVGDWQDLVDQLNALEDAALVHSYERTMLKSLSDQFVAPDSDPNATLVLRRNKILAAQFPDHIFREDQAAISRAVNTELDATFYDALDNCRNDDGKFPQFDEDSVAWDVRSTLMGHRFNMQKNSYQLLAAASDVLVLRVLNAATVTTLAASHSTVSLQYALDAIKGSAPDSVLYALRGNQTVLAAAQFLKDSPKSSYSETASDDAERFIGCIKQYLRLEVRDAHPLEGNKKVTLSNDVVHFCAELLDEFLTQMARTTDRVLQNNRSKTATTGTFYFAMRTFFQCNSVDEEATEGLLAEALERIARACAPVDAGEE